MTYVRPAQEAMAELVVKKSRFVAWAGPVSQRSEAQAALARRQQQHPTARHHCWAYLMGDPVAASTAAMNDDGEPGGTAGKPILQVIQHKAIGDVMVVVSRYFGGVKLGAGGLVRAYAGATEQVLTALPLARQVPEFDAQLWLDFAVEQPLRHWLEQHDGTIVNIAYQQQVAATVRVPEHARDALTTFCNERQLDYHILS